MSFWRRPHATFTRRLVLYLHSWGGLVGGLYALFIGVTGSALVFRADLQRFTYPDLFGPPAASAPFADPSSVIGAIEQRYPGYRFSGFEYPHAGRRTFLAYVAGADGLRTAFLNARTGAWIGELPRDGWIQRLQDLHYNFSSGPRGYVVNGIGAACLATMCLTGVVIWWPGIGRVGRAFTASPRHGERRFIRELHAATGIWCVALLLVWSVSGFYFSFPVGFRNAVARVITLTPSVSPQSAAPAVDSPPSLEVLVQRALARVPGGQVARVGIPAGERGTYSVTIARVRHGDGDRTDEVTVYYDRYSGAEVALVTPGRTAGDTLLTWLGRLHFGNFGGYPLRVVWFVAGLALPLLFVTGTVMWWIRRRNPSLKSL